MNNLNNKLKICTGLIIIMLAIVSNACKKYENLDDMVYITGTETDRLAKFTVEDIPSSFSVTATVTRKLEEDVSVHFKVDTSLVSDYNAEMSANYYVPPAGSYELSSTNAVIRERTNVSDPVTISITSTDDFMEGRSYMIPVTITEVDGPFDVLEPSRTIYLRVARVFYFNSVDISDHNFYHTYTFPDNAYAGLNEFTYEIKCYIDSWHSGNPPISRLSNWGPPDESMFNLLRFGEGGSDIDQLQWINTSGSVFSNTRFQLKRWYTISCVYDGSKARLYVDGVLDAEFDTEGQVYAFGLLELGMSYGGYEYSQRFLGRIAEVRLWNRALSRTEIQAGICGVYSGSPGLVAYWKLNEGEGQTFYDASGNGYDMVWPNTVVWNSDLDNKCAE